MSLESDLRRYPRGPATWRWAQRMMTAIARARGVVSGDQSIEVIQSPGGLTLRQTSDMEQFTGDIPADPFQVTKNTNGVCMITGGDLLVNSGDWLVVPDAILSPGNGSIIFVEMNLNLTAAGELLTPRPWETLDYDTEVTIGSLHIGSTGMFGFASGYVTPGSTPAATLRIPIAAIESGGNLRQWWHGLTGIHLRLYRTHFTITSA